MKIAITGAAGFIGRNLVSALAEQGHDLLAIDNEFRGSFNSLGEKKNISKLITSIRKSLLKTFIYVIDDSRNLKTKKNS